MPKGDRQELKADPEDGTTPISNLLLEALAIAKLSGKEKGAVLYLWRVTYGWQVEGARLKEQEIPLRTWGLVLQTSEGQASRILSALIEKRVVTRVFLGAGKGYSYSMNTRVAQWHKGCGISQGLLEMTTLLPQSGKTNVKSGGCQKAQPPSSSTRQPPAESATPVASNLASFKERLKKELNKVVSEDIVIAGGEIIKATELWQRTLVDLKNRVSPANYKWFSDTVGVGTENSTFFVRSPTKFSAEQIHQRIESHVIKSLSVVSGKQYEVCFVPL
jgi:phage replication O-like protein O